MERRAQKRGWIKNWTQEFIENPPDISKSNIKVIFRYIYFEKNIEDLKQKKLFNLVKKGNPKKILLLECHNLDQLYYLNNL